jgi:hypothetical protein
MTTPSTNLSQHIDPTNLSVLNATHDVSPSTLNATSDADEQLLLYVPFKQVVKISGLKFTGNARTVHVFVNRMNMGFEDAEAETPTQAFTFTGKPNEAVLTNFVRFQNVNSLTIFIKDNVDGSEKTHIDRIIIEGFPVETTQMKDFKRVAGDKNEAHSAI